MISPLTFLDYFIIMKKSDEFLSPASPASFLKKQSHIITNNTINQQFYPMTPNTREKIQAKEMHRSQFRSQAFSNKLMDQEYFDQHDLLEMYSDGKEKVNEEEKSGKPDKVGLAQIQSFYQSDQMSSEHDNSQTRSHKKFGFSANTLSQKAIKRPSNLLQQKFLFINSKKQKYNNNYLFLSDADALRQQIKKYQISIQKLKEQNFKLRAEKIKLSSTSESMQLIQSRLQLQSIKKKIKQLEADKIYLSINTKDDKPYVQTHHNGSSNPMAASCLETPTKNSERDEMPKRNIPTFRINQEKQAEKAEEIGPKNINSPRSRTIKFQNPQQNYKILQNMKSPYFLKKN